MIYNFLQQNCVTLEVILYNIFWRKSMEVLFYLVQRQNKATLQRKVLFQRTTFEYRANTPSSLLKQLW